VTPSRQSATQQCEPLTEVVWPQRTTYALAISLLPQLGFGAMWLATAGRPGNGATLALLAVWAVAMGMQSAAVRWLDVGGVFTTAATATFLFLIGSFAKRPLTGEERRRLFGVLVSLVIGATAGGYLLIDAPTYAPLLPFVITIGVVAMAAKVFGSRDDSHVLP
jgi:uncharacterized membrane protein YoaK (UPF0700 family)